MDADQKVGQRIKRLRLGLDMTQERLAALVRVTRQTVSEWEKGRRKINTDNLLRLAKVLGTTPEAIMEGVEGGIYEEVSEGEDRLEALLGTPELLYRALEAVDPGGERPGTRRLFLEPLKRAILEWPESPKRRRYLQTIDDALRKLDARGRE